MSTVKTSLVRLNEIRDEVKSLRGESIVLFKEVFNLIKEEAKNVKSMAMFSNSPKNVICNIVKANLLIGDIKDNGSTVMALNYYESGISLNLNDVDCSKAFIGNVLKLVKQGKLTKTFINSSDIKTIKEAIKAL